MQTSLCEDEMNHFLSTLLCACAVAISLSMGNNVQIKKKLYVAPYLALGDPGSFLTASVH